MSNRIRYAGLVEEENLDKRKKTTTKKGSVFITQGHK